MTLEVLGHAAEALLQVFLFVRTSTAGRRHRRIEGPPEFLNLPRRIGQVVLAVFRLSVAIWRCLFASSR